jgi:hypothetical protein
MKQSRKPSLKRTLARVGVFVFLPLLLGLFGVLITNQPVSAQAAGEFDWVNGGTIKARADGKVYYDPNPLEWIRGAGRPEYKEANNRTCSNATNGRTNVPEDRIFTALGSDGKPLLQAVTGDRLVINNNGLDTGAGVKYCDADTIHVQIFNPRNALWYFYRVGDTVYTFNNQYSFVKTGEASGSEIFVRSGEQNSVCPDILVKQFDQWLIFPMAGVDDDTATGAKSEVYQDSFGFPDTLYKCRVAPRELESVFHVAIVDPDHDNPPIYPNGWYATINTDDGYIIRNGVGGSENAPPAGAPPPGSPDAGGSIEEISACSYSFGFVSVITLKWLICPIVNMLTTGTEIMENFITNLLQIDLSPLDPGKEYHRIWASFRTLALGIIVISALVVIIVQALGIDTPAYAPRALAIRGAVAVFFIVISFPLIRTILAATNGITGGIRDLVFSPFNGAPFNAELSDGAAGMLILIGGGALARFGPLPLLTFVASALLSSALTAGIIIFAQSLLYAIAPISPVAIALGVLPNTRKAEQFVQNTFVSVVFGLIAVAFIMAILRVLSVVTANLDTNSAVNQVIALIERLVIPIAAGAVFLAMNGFIKQITGGAQSAVQNLQQGLAQRRADAGKRRGKRFREGTLWNGSRRGPLGAIARAGNAVGSHIGTEGKGFLGAVGIPTRRSRAAKANRRSAEIDQTLKENPGLAELANYDDANAVLAHSGGTMAGARQAATDLFGTTDSEQARNAIAAASVYLGRNGRRNATAAMRTYAQNKSRATGAGRVDITQRGINRLARTTEDREAIAGMYQFFSRQNGRADLGGRWNDAGRVADADAAGAAAAANVARAGGNAAQQATARQQVRAQTLTDLTMMDGVGRTEVPALVRGHTNQVRQLMGTWDASGAQTSQGTLERMLTSANADHRYEAALRILEMQKALPYANGDSQNLINDFFDNVGLAQTNLENDLATRVGPMAGVAGTALANRLNSQARVYDQATANNAAGTGP